MKLVTEYLAHVVEFERLASEEPDPTLKANLQKQAEAYYKLAVDRAKQMGQPVPPRPPSEQTGKK